MAIIDKFLLSDFFEYLVENYDLSTVRQRWIEHGTKSNLSLLKKGKKGKSFLIEDIANEYGEILGIEVSNAFNSEFLNPEYLFNKKDYNTD